MIDDNIKNLTEQQRKYYLIRLLQRDFSANYPVTRLYLFNFMTDLFSDPSVVITQEAFEDFVRIEREEIDYCARRGLYSLDSIHSDSAFAGTVSLLQRAFEAINIGFTVVDKSEYYILFSLPNGTEKKCQMTDTMWSMCTANVNGNQTYDYALRAYPVISLETMPIVGLDTIQLRPSGDDTYWDYDAEDQTIRFSGTGVCFGTYFLTGENSYGTILKDPVRTMIVGSSITGLRNKSINHNNISLVVLAPADVDFEITSSLWINSTIVTSLDIYTDNTSLRSAPVPTKTTVRWHSLSEWNP